LKKKSSNRRTGRGGFWEKERKRKRG